MQKYITSAIVILCNHLSYKECIKKLDVIEILL